MEKIGIFYGSTTGNTESIAKILSQQFDAELFDVSTNPIDAIKEYSNIILGLSTWGYGDLQDDWEIFLPKLANTDLSNKKIAIFGLGDSDTYADTFVDGIGIIYETIKNKGCNIVGQVSPDEYHYTESKALVDGKFIGLPLDEDNECNLTKIRIDNWVNQLKESFKQ